MTATQFLSLERKFCSDDYFVYHGIEALRRKIREMERFTKECKNWIDRDTMDGLKNRLIDARSELKAREDVTNPCRECAKYSVVWYFDKIEEYRNCEHKWSECPTKCPHAAKEKRTE